MSLAAAELIHLSRLKIKACLFLDQQPTVSFISKSNGPITDQEKDVSFFKDATSEPAAQQRLISSKKGHVFFLISNRPNIHISNKCNNSIFLHHTSYSMHLMSLSDVH